VLIGENIYEVGAKNIDGGNVDPMERDPRDDGKPYGP
jgi:hypothetical protein